MNESQLIFFRKTSLVDYPEKVAAAIFFPFCNLRCPWCHNGSLITEDPQRRDTSGLIPLRDALSHIKKRALVLDGAVLSGGEPTLYNGLEELIAVIKEQGLAVKLDTNGTHPALLAHLLAADAHPDYVAMDLKFDPRRYESLLHSLHKNNELCGKVLESIALLRKAHAEGKIQLEFRSLALPRATFCPEDIAALAPLVGNAPWSIRPFRPGGCLDPAWNLENEISENEVARLARLIPFTAADQDVL
ncbi:MAG: anaerobic ribonucleoside-triphosphate reductase activating protein [Spirochaetaceae bacterium]|jgi:pyruvate formate lyase activating enzyme|nr:anaerobic ribonucleoside-triphosphate reductase activating protein [Spirochaetaceae bacterium]